MTAAAIDRSWSNLLGFLVGDTMSGMGTYLLSLKAWAMFGSSDIWLRTFSVVGGAVAVSLLATLAREWFGPATAWLAVALTVTNPFFLNYLTELRSYSWLMALALASTLFLTQAVDTGRWIDFAAYGAVVGIGLGFHLLFCTVVIAHLSSVLLSGGWRMRGAAPRFGLAALVAGVALAPYAAALFSSVESQTWLPEPSLKYLIRTAMELMGGWATACLLATGFLSFVIRFCMRSPRELTAPRNALVLSLAALPVLFLTLVSFWVPLLLDRYLASSLPFITLVAAAGLVGIDLSATVRVAVPLAVAALTIGLFVSNSPLSDRSVEDLRGAAAFLDASRRPGDAVVFYPNWARHGFVRYWPEDPEADLAFKAWNPVGVQPYEYSASELRRRLRGRDRIWLLRYDGNPRWKPFPDPVLPLLPLLEGQRPFTERRFGEFVVIGMPMPEQLRVGR